MFFVAYILQRKNLCNVVRSFERHHHYLDAALQNTELVIKFHTLVSKISKELIK